MSFRGKGEGLLNYRHQVNGALLDLPVGKAVCVGRNYAAHAQELNNPIPTEPVLFIKPNTALVALGEQLPIPTQLGECHIETEICILIADKITRGCDRTQVEAAIGGVGVALDLTLRGLQQQLKDASLPWEKAKAFDGACPISAFVSLENIDDLHNQQIQLRQNGELRQDGNSADMLTPVLPLLVYISQFFTLTPGDIVLTGTPAGVGPLAVGDSLDISLGDIINVQTKVVGRD
jgi:2-keto-4-pentenoate hydratase/2-oxohepta-3-ene-1,7-dioic acid hydratase in catechol pathway